MNDESAAVTGQAIAFAIKVGGWVVAVSCDACTSVVVARIVVQTARAACKVTRSIVAVGGGAEVARSRNGAAVVDAQAVAQGCCWIVVVCSFHGASCAACKVVTPAGDGGFWVEVACRWVHAASA